MCIYQVRGPIITLLFPPQDFTDESSMFIFHYRIIQSRTELNFDFTETVCVEAKQNDSIERRDL